MTCKIPNEGQRSLKRKKKEEKNEGKKVKKKNKSSVANRAKA